MTEENCIICKHPKTLHAITLVNNIEFCADCTMIAVQDPSYSCKKPLFARHKFKLDNLQLVEDLAKERNLV
jgi:hypothetical protein